MLSFYGPLEMPPATTLCWWGPFLCDPCVCLEQCPTQARNMVTALAFIPKRLCDFDKGSQRVSGRSADTLQLAKTQNVLLFFVSV